MFYIFSMFSMVSMLPMFSKLTPCSPIRDGRIQQFLQPWRSECLNISLHQDIHIIFPTFSVKPLNMTWETEVLFEFWKRRLGRKRRRGLEKINMRSRLLGEKGNQTFCSVEVFIKLLKLSTTLICIITLSCHLHCRYQYR